MTESARAARGRATLITAAEPPYEEQLRSRRRRYVVVMGMRVPFLIAAAATYHIPWLALGLMAVSVPLPWCAVLIANDRPARKKSMRMPGLVNPERALVGPPRQIVDGDGGPDGTAPGSDRPPSR